MWKAHHLLPHRRRGKEKPPPSKERNTGLTRSRSPIPECYQYHEDYDEEDPEDEIDPAFRRQPPSDKYKEFTDVDSILLQMKNDEHEYEEYFCNNFDLEIETEDTNNDIKLEDNGDKHNESNSVDGENEDHFSNNIMMENEMEEMELKPKETKKKMETNTNDPIAPDPASDRDPDPDEEYGNMKAANDLKSPPYPELEDALNRLRALLKPRKASYQSSIHQPTLQKMNIDTIDPTLDPNPNSH